MGITQPSSLSWAVFKEFGYPQSGIDKAVSLGITISQKKKPGVYGVYLPSGKLVGEVTLSGPIITLKKAGKLGAQVVAKFHHEINSLVGAAIEYAIPPYGILPDVPPNEFEVSDLGIPVNKQKKETFPEMKGSPATKVVFGDGIAALAKAAPPGTALKSAGIASSSSSTPLAVGIGFSYHKQVGDLQGNLPLTLGACSKVGHPVTGTSSGSIYTTVAVGSHLNVAARKKGVSLSIRIEGPAIADLESKKLLEGYGFSYHPSYASLHLLATSPNDLARIIGSVIFALGFSNFQQVLDPYYLPEGV